MDNGVIYPHDDGSLPMSYVNVKLLIGMIAL